MGACGSSLSPEEKAAQARTKQMDKKLKQQYDKEQRKIKLLLLGAGESGKSTIFKQMKILYGEHNGYTKEERTRFKPVVYGNILTNMKTLLENTENHTPVSDESLKAKIPEFQALEDGKNAVIDAATGELVKAFWSDPGVQATWHQRAQFQVQDALSFYCESIDRIAADDYIPVPQDILRARVRTSGIVTEVYKIDQVTFEMYDVGGQRNERKKWIHAFDEVTAVIFVAAASEYDQVLFEDQSMNRMDEAVILFDEICNSQYFVETAFILFLNKDDLLREKLRETPFRIDDGPHARFTDYTGPVLKPGDDWSEDQFNKLFDATRKYILQLFLNRNKSNKDIYYRFCTATDTKNVQVVFNASKDIILQKNLSNLGFSGPRG